ncbi:type II toxin-antitoxin system HicB family antitoxin [Streptacidiphilus sp. EB129]|uniref:type II toxin-antitoxin system HicB family antitoxin n=1 Tax=Streptacidiphilus sp. EB129 TaxID=3156262 RepID=UPI0035182594
MTKYRVTAQRSGDWWALSVPDLPGVHSQTKRLDQAEGEIREAIALMLDCEPEDFEVAVEPELQGLAKAVLAQLAAARDAAEQVTEALRLATARAVLVLTEDLSQRDVGSLLGVSFQRVHQIKDAAPPLPEVELQFEQASHGLQVIGFFSSDETPRWVAGGLPVHTHRSAPAGPSRKAKTSA